MSQQLSYIIHRDAAITYSVVNIEKDEKRSEKTNSGFKVYKIDVQINEKDSCKRATYTISAFDRKAALINLLSLLKFKDPNFSRGPVDFRGGYVLYKDRIAPINNTSDDIDNIDAILTKLKLPEEEIKFTSDIYKEKTYALKGRYDSLVKRMEDIKKAAPADPVVLAALKKRRMKKSISIMGMDIPYNFGERFQDIQKRVTENLMVLKDFEKGVKDSGINDETEFERAKTEYERDIIAIDPNLREVDKIAKIKEVYDKYNKIRLEHNAKMNGYFADKHEFVSDPKKFEEQSKIMQVFNYVRGNFNKKVLKQEGYISKYNRCCEEFVKFDSAITEMEEELKASSGAARLSAGGAAPAPVAGVQESRNEF